MRNPFSGPHPVPVPDPCERRRANSRSVPRAGRAWWRVALGIFRSGADKEAPLQRLAGGCSGKRTRAYGHLVTAVRCPSLLPGSLETLVFAVSLFFVVVVFDKHSGTLEMAALCQALANTCWSLPCKARGQGKRLLPCGATHLGTLDKEELTKCWKEGWGRQGRGGEGRQGQGLQRCNCATPQNPWWGREGL